MEQLNISQLRNLWLRSPDERLASWREFRIELQSLYDCGDDPFSSLSAIATWWEQAPLVSVAIDPFNSEVWPSIWEIIYYGECCKYSKGLAMAYNIHYMDSDIEVTLARAYDTTYNDEYMIAIYDGEFALNSLHGSVINLHDVDSFDIRESWNIQEHILQNQD